MPWHVTFPEAELLQQRLAETEGWEE